MAITNPMSTDSFQLTYNGRGVRNGAMDVYELAPALVAVGDLVRDANRFLNGDQAAVNIKVDSDFKKGSFDIRLLLDQQLLDASNHALPFASFVDASGLIHALFGAIKEHGDKVTEGVLLGLFAIYKLLKGEKPKAGSVVIEDNHGTINLGDTSVKVDARGAQLYMNDAIRSDVDHVARSVAKDGIDKLEVLKDGQLLDDITKDDLPTRIKDLEAAQESSEHVLTDTREALVKVVTANFEKGKWKFSDGGSKFNATISDPVFQRKLDDRQEGFYKGDVLRVVIKTEQTEKADGKIQAQYTIQEVLEHRRLGDQQALLPPDSAIE
jgi:hypothetical protein